MEKIFGTAALAILLEQLNAYAAHMLQEKSHFIGYPVYQDTELEGFYKWYMESGLYDAAMNNAGDQYKTKRPAAQLSCL